MKRIAFIIMCLFLTGCSTIQTHKPTTKNKQNTENVIKIQSNVAKNEIIKNYNKWHGTKYKLGGNNKHGIDCSAFVGKIYKDSFNLNLRRATAELKYEWKKIKKENLKFGDMVFFRKNAHVGIYVGNGEFIHSSTKKGVTKSSLIDGYYATQYTQARRIINN